ncbi:MAG: tail fiber protein [Ignavibacteria bacterium]|nr:tail fiber protein [Ignavibacteria bacterium]
MASSEPLIGSIDMWPVTWAPELYALCNGQLLPVNSYQALYSLIGNLYGGDAVNFALPNLKGRFPVGMGIAFGKTYNLGSVGGNSAVTLTSSNIPIPNHTHAVAGSQVQLRCNSGTGTTNSPVNMYPAISPGGDSFTDTAVSGKTLKPPQATVTVNPAFSAPTSVVPTLPPYAVTNYIIATRGDYPVHP